MTLAPQEKQVVRCRLQGRRCFTGGRRKMPRARERLTCAGQSADTAIGRACRGKVQYAAGLGTSLIGFVAVSSRIDFNNESGPSPLRTNPFTLERQSSGTST